jgi:hypothetical protein
MIDEPQIVQTDADPAAVIRLTIPREEIRNVMGPGMAELMAVVAAQGITPAGPIFSHHSRPGHAARVRRHARSHSASCRSRSASRRSRSGQVLCLTHACSRS